ncbi:MAG: hypothetical protein LZ166_05520, partial [Thaumarchaeota archaeon]|nr:hypothetical protein [Candidatus Wolframiiraptor allenii]
LEALMFILLAGIAQNRPYICFMLEAVLAIGKTSVYKHFGHETTIYYERVMRKPYFRSYQH